MGRGGRLECRTPEKKAAGVCKAETTDRPGATKPGISKGGRIEKGGARPLCRGRGARGGCSRGKVVLEEPEEGPQWPIGPSLPAFSGTRRSPRTTVPPPQFSTFEAFQFSCAGLGADVRSWSPLIGEQKKANGVLRSSP